MRRSLLYLLLFICYTTSGQLRLVKDIRDGNSSSNPDNFVIYNNSLFYTITIPNSHGIGKSDATPLNTEIYLGSSSNTAIDTKNTPSFTELNNVLYFVAEVKVNGVNRGIELLKTSGEKTNKYSLVKDINAGASNASPDKLTVYNNEIYFIATTANEGRELWKTDGTETGTVIVKNINPNNSDARIGDLIVYNNKLFFTANDGVNGDELWMSDGTETGTQMVKNIASGATNSTPRSFITYNNKLYFTANDGNTGRELYTSDGTSAGTYLINDLNNGSDGSHPTELTVFNNNLIFAATTASLGTELVKMNPSENISSLGNINISGDSNPLDLIIYNNKLFFTANDGNKGRELYSTNGFPSGTGIVADINSGTNSSNPRNFLTYNNTLYFRADDGTLGAELWSFNDATNSASLVQDIVTGAGSSNPLPQIVYDGEMILSVDKINDTGRELWAYTDPTLQTYTPDDNFEQLLIDLGYDTTLDDYVATGIINTVITINANGTNNPIADFTGIEDFKYLQNFNTFLNTEASLDLSANSNLTVFNIFQDVNMTNLTLPNKHSSNLKIISYTLGQLTTLDLSNYENLEGFSTQGDQNLTTLNLADNPSLTSINLINMPSLTSLNITNSPELTSFTLTNCLNFNTNLDYSNFTKMTNIFIENTGIQSVDLSNNNLLTSIYVRDNQLTDLNIKNGANSIITQFYATNNTNLGCINVDDENLSSSGNGVYASWFKDTSAVYSENCSALSVDKFKNKKIKLFPNPIKDFFHLDHSLNDVKTIIIYDLNGRKVKTFLQSNLNIYSVYDLKKGIYLLQINSEKEINPIRLIKL